MKKLSETSGYKQVRKAILQQAMTKIDETLSVESKSLIFHDRLIEIIRPRNQSDRTSFRRITNWAQRLIKEGRAKEDIFKKILGYAIEASGPDSRNPAAVFMAIIKKELGYGRE